MEDIKLGIISIMVMDVECVMVLEEEKQLSGFFGGVWVLRNKGGGYYQWSNRSNSSSIRDLHCKKIIIRGHIHTFVKKYAKRAGGIIDSK